MKKISLKIFSGIILSVFIIEGILLVISLQNKEKNLYKEKARIEKSFNITVKPGQMYSDEWISKEVVKYRNNIIYLTILIAFFVALSAILIVHFDILKYLNKIKALNEEQNIPLYKDKIPHDEIGDFINKRNQMIDKISKQQLLLKEDSNLLNDMLTQSSKLANIGEITNGILHDIKNPLQSINLNLEVMKYCPEKTDDSIDKIQ